MVFVVISIFIILANNKRRGKKNNPILDRIFKLAAHCEDRMLWRTLTRWKPNHENPPALR